MLKFIASLDKFGAIYKPKLKNKSKNYKTVLGGFVSLAIYLLSFIYFSYKINQFGKNQMNPLQSLIYEYRDDLTMNIENQLLQFEVKNTEINPFNQTNQILTPIMLKQGSDKLISPTIYVSSEEIYQTNQINFTTQVYTPTGLTLSRNNENYPTTILIGFQICNITSQSNCADQTEIEKFFNQSNLLIRTTIITQQFDTLQRSFTQFSRNLDFALDKSVIFYQRIIMEPLLIDYDDSPLLSNSNQHWIFSDYTIQTQSLQSSYKSELSGVFIAELSMSDVNQKNSIQFIKISQVLADVGSIFSSLMVLSILVSKINEAWMEQEIILEIITIFYPNFKKIKIYRRWFYFGKINSVTYNNKQIDLKSFIKFYKPVVSIAKQKLTVLNNIYQISRLQFALQQIVTRSTIEKMHNEGINLPLYYQSDQETKTLKKQHQLNDPHIEQELTFTLKQDDYLILHQLNDIKQACEKLPQYDKIESPRQDIEYGSQKYSGSLKSPQDKQIKIEKKSSEDLSENDIERSN